MKYNKQFIDPLAIFSNKKPENKQKNEKTTSNKKNTFQKPKKSSEMVAKKEEAENILVPPCISNWKNRKGYSVSLDIRNKNTANINVNGRKQQVSDKFETFSYSLAANSDAPLSTPSKESHE